MNQFKTAKGTELPILNLRGKDYLEVKYRLVWFREERPDWSIETEFVKIEKGSALARAVIRNPSGQIMATSHKFEDVSGFPDFLEKSETGAIGRALALLGYGTQFCADELDEGKRIVDSPVNSVNRVGPEQPMAGDGNMDASNHWKFTFGKWNMRTLEEVYRDPKGGPDGMKGYINYLETNSLKTGKPLSATAVDAIKQMETFLGAMENGHSNLEEAPF